MGRTLSQASVITRVPTIAEAKALPRGTVVGDRHGGVTFSDSVAEVLEERSADGWRDVTFDDGENWTIIVVHH